MDGRTLAALLAVALVALAGCSGGGGAGSPTAADGPDASDGTETADGTDSAGETDTGSDETTPGTPVADAEPLDLQSVTTDAGLNTSALLLAHVRALNRSGGYRIEANRTVLVPEGADIRRTVVTGTTAPLRFRYRVTGSFRNASGSFLASRTDEYLTADSRYVRTNDTLDGDPPSYSTSESDRQRTRQRFQGGTIGFTEAGYYQMFAFEFAGNVTRDGTSLYRFSADGFADSNRGPRNASDPSATLLVDRSGVIRSADLYFENANTGQALDLSMRTTAVGDVTVAEPDWLDQARAETGG